MRLNLSAKILIICTATIIAVLFAGFYLIAKSEG
ncbi:hypothetical protein LCGC14_3125040, partial [marine sediment metagenome]